MARTDEDAVIAILQDYDTSFDLEAFIDAATMVVDDYCLNSDYADAKLLKIETYLAAHFYEVTVGRPVTEQVGSGGAGARTTFESKIGLGLDLTRYGQMAKLLDPKMSLAAADLAVKKNAGAFFKPVVKFLGSND
jgi:hypothetical protein